MENSEEVNRPYICLKCGWRSFNYPNVHTCTDKWPLTNEEWDARWAAEIENDPLMKEWIKYVNRKYGA